MNMKRFFTGQRFSMIDSVCITAGAVYFTQGKFLYALMVFLFGVIVAVIVGYQDGNAKKDKKWKQFADGSQKVAAIREHRIVYGSSLKEALDAVDAYLNRSLR